MYIFLNNEKKEVPDNCSAYEVAQMFHLSAPDQALAVKIDDKTYDLSHKLEENDHISFVNFAEQEGKDIFWHTAAHVLAQAVLRLWPKAILTIGPPIEHGFYYDFANLEISENDFPKIEQEVKNILKENYTIERIEFANKEKALEAYGKNPYKKEMIEEFEEGPITAYKQGEFSDLCRGPHLPNLNKIKAFKVLKTSGAYWRGDSKNTMLTRIYAIAFPDRKLLIEYMHFLEEAKKREHKRLGTQLDLFSFKEEAPGMPFIHPRGLAIWEALLSFLRKCLQEANYEEIKTPMMMSKELWIRSGHWEHYRENMYLSEVENRSFAIKPMNCPGCMLYYKSHTHSYRELPLRVAEIGHVHRHEPSGALHGLFRVRSFHQDDAHIFMQPQDIKDEIVEVLHLCDKIYMTFGLSYKLELSTRPEKEKTIGSDEDWELATKGLQQALDKWGHTYTINEGDGAFYGPKIDIHIRDALGRFWQCGTIQLDLSLPEKFQLEYIDADGKHKRPIMIHRAIFGSIERFFGILIEHFAAKFPLWLSPCGIRIIPVADRHIEYAEKIQRHIKKANLLCDIDTSHESVSKKIRNAQLMQINYMLTVGDTEIENHTIAVRTRDNVLHKEMSIEKFISIILKEKENRDLISPLSLQPTVNEE